MKVSVLLVQLERNIPMENKSLLKEKILISILYHSGKDITYCCSWFYTTLKDIVLVHEYSNTDVKVKKFIPFKKVLSYLVFAYE